MTGQPESSGATEPTATPRPASRKRRRWYWLSI